MHLKQAPGFMVMLGSIGRKEMNDLVREIPYIELLLIFVILGLSGLGYFTQLNRGDSPDPLKYGLIGKWILAGLIGVAFLAILLFFVASLVRV